MLKLKLEMEKTQMEMAEQGMKTENIDSNNNTWYTKAPKFKTGDNFNTFCERFIDYVEMTNRRSNLDKLFMFCVDDDTYTTLKTVVENLTENEKIDAQKLCEILQEEYLGHTQTSIKQQLMNLKQGPNENITQFCNAIRQKARAAYGAVEHAGDIALLVLLRGLRDTTVRRKLNEAVCGSFEEAMRLAKHLESVDTLIKQSETPTFDSEEQEIKQVTTDTDHNRGRDYHRGRSNSPRRNYGRNNSRERYNSHRYRSNSRSRSSDRYRNRSPHPNRRYNDQRSSNSRKCYHCGQNGHFIANCNKKHHLN
eukprot:sb/3467161/